MLNRITILASVAVVMAVTSANAQSTTKVVQKFRDWVLYSHNGSSANICFLSTWPKKKNPAGYNRGRSYFYISAWPKDGVKAEVSIKLAKQLRDGSSVSIRIGGERYSLFTKDNEAFVSDPTRELKLINSMKRGSRMFVRATTADGTEIEDEYSLSGVTAGVNKMTVHCS
ncbi:MAG: invasion associated locus B family protein [Hyphomicrobiaceae bacterium]